MTTKHTDPCTELELVKKDIDHLTEKVLKVETVIDGDIKQDLSTIKQDVDEIKTVNAFLAKEVKEIIDVKNKINTTILKYVSKFVFIIFSIGVIIILIKYGPLVLKLLK